jgi:FkbM family methyltransferase
MALQTDHSSKEYGVTADDIVASIEMILGWTPDQASIDYHLGLGFRSRRELGQYMISTEEFRDKHQNFRFAPTFLGDRVLTHTHAGDRIYLVPGDVDLTPSIMIHGRYETDVEQAIRRVVRDGDVAVDIGANVGYQTLAIARSVASNGRVYAFEANPEVHRLLLATLMVNGLTSFRSTGRVNLYNMAVADRDGTLKLSYAPSHYGSGNIVTDDPRSSFGPEYSKIVEVPAVRLDDLLADVPAIDFLHSDIEGAEPLAFRGARALIQRSPNLKIITEWSVHMMRHMANVEEHAEWLKNEGFRFWRVGANRSFSVVRPTELLSLDHCDLYIARSDPD